MPSESPNCEGVIHLFGKRCPMFDKEAAKYYQRMGFGYKKVASLLDENINTVKAFMKRNPITDTCLCCGCEIKYPPKKKKKLFCSDACRYRWWNKHTNIRKYRNPKEVVCAYCHKPFQTNQSSKRKYCSRECFHNALRNGGKNNG